MTRKRKIALYGFNARGHTRALLQIAKALLASGFEVDYLTASEDVAEFRVLGTNIYRIDASFLKRSKDRAVPKSYDNKSQVTSITLRLIDDEISNVPQIIGYFDRNRPDLFIFDKMCFGGDIISRHFQIPSAMIHPNYAGSRRIPGANSIFDDPTDPEIIAEFGKRLDAFHALSAYAPRSIAELLDDHQFCNISFMSKEFHPTSQTLNLSHHFVGPLIPDFEHNGSERKEMVYISFGSIFGVNQDDFFKRCISAITRSRREVIISVANDLDFVKNELGDLPQSVSVVKSFDQSGQLANLAKAKAFITHGGMNSVQEAIWLQTPMVVAPSGMDMRFTAHRIEEIDCGVAIKSAESTVESISSALETVIASDTIKAGLKNHREYARSSGGVESLLSIIHSL